MDIQLHGSGRDTRLTLRGAPAGKLVEVRWQNTMNGVATVATAEVNDDGTVDITPPLDFGQHQIPSVRVITPGHSEDVPTQFHVEDNEDGTFFFTSGTPPTTPAPAAHLGPQTQRTAPQ